MKADWLIHNQENSLGFVAQRVQIATYTAISLVYGSAAVMNHGRTELGIPIGQILKQTDMMNQPTGE